MGTDEETQYSVSTHIPQLAINELWAGTTLWPLKRNGDEVYFVDKILILGGHRQWDRLRPSNTPALVGALFLIVPVEIWKRVMHGTLTSAMGEEEIQEELGETEPPEATSRKKGGEGFGLDLFRRRRRTSWGGTGNRRKTPNGTESVHLLGRSDSKRP